MSIDQNLKCQTVKTASNLFTEEWALDLVLVANAKILLRKKFAGAGLVQFKLEPTSGDERLICFNWDVSGISSLVPWTPKRNDPIFTSDDEGWKLFLKGEILSVEAVMKRVLQYRGPLWFPIKYASAFDALVTELKNARHKEN